MTCSNVRISAFIIELLALNFNIGCGTDYCKTEYLQVYSGMLYSCFLYGNCGWNNYLHSDKDIATNCQCSVVDQWMKDLTF